MRGPGQIRALAEIARPDVGVDHGDCARAPRAARQHRGDRAREGGAARGPAAAAASRSCPADAPELEPFVPAGVDVRRFAAAGRGSARRARARALRRPRCRLLVRRAPPGCECGAALTVCEALGVPLPDGARRRRRSRAGARRSASCRAAGSSSTTPGTRTRSRCRLRSRICVDRAAGRRTVAILGEMAELGGDAERFHAEVGASTRPASTSSSASGSWRAATSRTSGSPTRRQRRARARARPARATSCS